MRARAVRRGNPAGGGGVGSDPGAGAGGKKIDRSFLYKGEVKRNSSGGGFYLKYGGQKMIVFFFSFIKMKTLDFHFQNCVKINQKEAFS
jgi:hypothetical protein